MAVKTKLCAISLLLLVLMYGCKENITNSFSTVVATGDANFYRLEIQYSAKYMDKVTDRLGGSLDPYSDINPSIEIAFRKQMWEMNNKEFIHHLSDGSLIEVINEDLKEDTYLEGINVRITLITQLKP